ncbi:MAG: hypothetical protein AAF468_00785 [Pseudomonadota bacterium]
MFESAARWIAGPEVGLYWLVFSMAVLVLPVIAITIWYHRAIAQDEGGQALMEEQNRVGVRLRSANDGARTHAQRQKDRQRIKDTKRMAADISSGKYGDQAKAIQNRMYLYFLYWIVATVLVFTPFLWGISLNQAAG